MTADESQLARSFRQSEPDAFDEVYRTYGGRMLAYAQQVTGSRTDAEDLTQEVFLAAYAGRGSFRGRSSLLTWLFSIASRRWRDGRRSRSAQESPMDPASMPDAGGPGGLSLDAIRLRDAVATLDRPMAEAFHLVMVQGLTHAEAAQAMGRPLGTVKWYTATAVRRLREVLQDDSRHEPKDMQQGEPRRPDRAADRRAEQAAGLGAAGAPADAHRQVRGVFG